MNAVFLLVPHLFEDSLKPKSDLIMCDSSAGVTHCCFLDGLAPSKTRPHGFLVLPLLLLLSGHKTQTAVLLGACTYCTHISFCHSKKGIEQKKTKQ